MSTLEACHTGAAGNDGGEKTCLFPRALLSEIGQGAAKESTRLRLSGCLEFSEDPVPFCVVTAFATSAARAAPIGFKRGKPDLIGRIGDAPGFGLISLLNLRAPAHS
jgi:hypothetical protein